MITNINKVNDRSITKIIFDDKGVKLSDLDYLNYVFTKNGLYMVQKNDFAVTYDKMNFNYKNLALANYEFGHAWKILLPRAPKEILQEILECFKYVVGKTKDELMSVIYYDKWDKEFILDIIKIQVVSGALAKYAYTKKYEMDPDDRYVKFCEIHSHNTMGANFSGTDNNDEKQRILCGCGVLGKIDHKSNIYSVDQSFRIWGGTRFFELKAYDLFDIDLECPKLAESRIAELDEILRISKIAHELDKKQRANNAATAPHFPLGMYEHNQGVINKEFGNETIHLDGLPSESELNDMDDDELDNIAELFQLNEDDDYSEEDVENLRDLIDEGK